MKSTAKNKMYSFILLMSGMVFITNSNVLAQCGPCSGSNKVRITKITYNADYTYDCKTKCVQEDQLQNYYEQGWTLGSGCRGKQGCGGNSMNSQLDEKEAPLIISLDPYSASSTISLSLAQSGKLSLKVFDITGKLIVTIADGAFKEGPNEISWNTNGLMPGIYLLQAQSTESMQTAKLLISN